MALSIGSTKYRRAVRALTRELTVAEVFLAAANASSISSLSVGSAPISATNYNACASVCACPSQANKEVFWSETNSA